MGKRTPMNSSSVKAKPQKPVPSLRELTEKSARIKLRLNSRASSIDSDTNSLLMAIRNVGSAPLTSAGWIMAMALTAVSARSSLPLWLKIAASTAREVLANPKPEAPARASATQTASIQSKSAQAKFAQVKSTQAKFAQATRPRASSPEP